jgi:hypothetical protein
MAQGPATAWNPHSMPDGVPEGQTVPGPTAGFT